MGRWLLQDSGQRVKYPFTLYYQENPPWANLCPMRCAARGSAALLLTPITGNRIGLLPASAGVARCASHAAPAGGSGVTMVVP